MVCRSIIGAVAVTFVFTSCKGENATPSERLDLVGKVSVDASTDPKRQTDIGAREGASRGRLFTVDLINDLLFRKKRDGWTLLTPEADVNVVKLNAGQVDLIFAAVQVEGNAPNSLKAAYEELKALVADTGGRVQLVQNMGQVEANRKQGIVSMMIVLEGSDGLGDLAVADLIDLRRNSVAVVGLVSARGNELADSFNAPPSSPGLTEKGIALVQNLRESGLPVNLTFASEETFWDVLVDQGVLSMVNYSACRFLRDHPRNLDDLQMLALARYGGVMGLVFNPDFIASGEPSAITIDDVVDHYKHARSIGALNAMAIGSDYNGIIPPKGLKDISTLPLLRRKLEEAGFSEAEIAGIFGEHIRKFMEAAETRQGSAEVASTDLLRPIALDCDNVVGESQGVLSHSCDRYVLSPGPTLQASTRQRFRLSDMSRRPQKLEIFGVPNTPWQVEAQNLDGKVLVHRSVLLDKDGRGELPMPSDRNLSRFFLFPTRPSQLNEAVLWGR